MLRPALWVQTNSLAAGMPARSWAGLVAGRLGPLATPDLPDPGLGGHLDRVPGAAERRGIAQVQVAETLHRIWWNRAVAGMSMRLATWAR
jgi:hypothetical protein